MSGMNKLKCIIGDVGTKIMLARFDNPAKEGKKRAKLLCKYSSCNEEALADDIIVDGGAIAHFCEKHRQYYIDEEFLKLVELPEI